MPFSQRNPQLIPSVPKSSAANTKSPSAVVITTAVDDFSSSEHIIKVSPNPSDYKILLETPKLDKFDADKKTFTLKFDIGSLTNNSCVNILVVLLQSPSQWPQGHSLTIMFLKDDQNFGKDVVAAATSQFNKYNIVQDSAGIVRISKHSYQTITT